MRRCLGTCLAATLIGCAPASPHGPVPPPDPLTPPPGYTRGPAKASFATTPARVWAALPKAYRAVGITVNAADTATRSMGFAGTIRGSLGGVRLSKFFNCGDQVGENADHYDINLFVATQVASDPRTRRMMLSTGLRVSARSPAFASTTTVCTSTGELERRIMAALEAELAH